MIIEPPNKRPPKAFWLPFWICEACGRIMIFERGVKRYSGYHLATIYVCPACDKEYLDSLFDEESEDKE